MPAGPGKYDDACTQARQATGGEAVVLIVLDGEQGSGFSVQVAGESIAHLLPFLLRTTADQIERSLNEDQS